MRADPAVKILIVEDNPADVAMLRDACETQARFACELTVVERLAEGAAAVRAGRFAVVLLDLGLPDAQGLDTLRRFMRLAPPPVLVLTGLHDENAGLEAVRQGAQDYLVKDEIRPRAVARAVLYAIERRRTTDELERSRARLRRLAERLLAVREAERTRISREIHDVLGQQLTGLKMDLRWLARHAVPPATDDQLATLRGRIAESENLADETIDLVQRLALELRPGVLDQLGLVEAVRDAARRFEARTTVALDLELPETGGPMPPELATACFRIFEEVLTNIARHAAAHRVLVAFTRTESAIELVVRDDGRGFAPATVQDSLGIVGMTERAKLLDGTVAIESAPGQGCTVRVRLPLTTST